MGCSLNYHMLVV